MLVLATCLFFATLIFIAWRFASGPVDVVMLFTLVYGLFYGFRGLLLTFGLDLPYPEEFHVMANVPEVAAETLLWLTFFLVCFAVGLYVTSEVAPTHRTLFFAARMPSTSRLVLVTVALTALATLISVPLLLRYGGLSEFVRAVKVEKDLVGLYFLKVPAAIGAFTAVATFLQLRGGTGVARRTSVVVLLCAILDGFWVFIWGQRSTLVILGVMLVLGAFVTRKEKLRTRNLIISLGLAAVLVLGVSLGLRYARDQLISGGVQDVVGEASFARKVSIGSNSTYFDASMLAFRDWPKEYPYRMGDDFVAGASGFVPRAVWEGKPKTVVAGRGFRNVYQPRIVNGWPLGAPTLWWLNFGPLGVAIGGLISGLVFGVLRRAQLNSEQSGLNVAIALVTTIYVFQTGVGPEWPVYFSAWLLPLALIVWFARSRAEGPVPQPVPTEPVQSARPS